MAKVIKQINRGASYYGHTIAIGEVNIVKRTGFMSCGSGDDHHLTAAERKLVDKHDSENDLILAPGSLKVS